MDYRSHFLKIKAFLEPYQSIWKNEIMLLYPTPLIHFPKTWIKDLKRIKTSEDIVKLERKEFDGLISDPTFLTHMEEMRELEVIPSLEAPAPLVTDAFTFLFMIPKKQHEIKRLAPLVKDFYQTKSANQIIDIGGGLGLLAQTLSNYCDLPVISVDMDPDLQNTGRGRNLKNKKMNAPFVDYRLIKVDSENAEFLNLLGPRSLTVGLHTCGELACSQIRSSIKKNSLGLINFGCCYHKLSEDSKSQNLSQFSQENGPLWMNKFALTLSCRAHRKMPEDTFDYKLKVKRMRYTMHFLLTDEYGQKEMQTLGNSPTKLYEGSFSTYALEQLKRLNIQPKHTPEELDQYFEAPERQELIQDMLYAGIIRDSFGRLLELYLLLDRVIFLEEKGYKAQLVSCFDEVISPRNLGIFAFKE
jgi:hypothetical protein